jgi:hypothetical protein
VAVDIPASLTVEGSVVPYAVEKWHQLSQAHMRVSWHKSVSCPSRRRNGLTSRRSLSGWGILLLRKLRAQVELDYSLAGASGGGSADHVCEWQRVLGVPCCQKAKREGHYLNAWLSWALGCFLWLCFGEPMDISQFGGVWVWLRSRLLKSSSITMCRL